MFGVDRKKLGKLLEEIGCESVDYVMQTLEMYFKFAESGIFTLASKDESKENQVKELLNSLGLDVRKIVSVSIKNPEWTAEGAFGNFLLKYHEIDFNFSGPYEALEGTFLGTDYEKALDSVVSRLWHALDNYLFFTFSNSLGFNLRFCQKTLKHFLFFFLCSAIVNDKERTEKLGALLSLLPMCLVFGNKNDEPTTWVAMVA